MADFHATQTDNTSVGDSIISLWNQATLFEAQYELVCDQFATKKTGMGGIMYFPRFAQMTPNTTALTDSVDPASTEVTDTAVSLTATEYGDVITYNIKAELQSGRVSEAATKLIGHSMGSSLDKIAMTRLESFSTTVIYPNSATSAATCGLSDVLDRKFAGRLYNKLARKNIPGVVGGAYAGIAHDDNLFDLRQDAGNGNWVSVNQYSNLTNVLTNEVGMFEGIRWFRSKNVTVTANSNGTIDTYKVEVLGANALGKFSNQEARIVISGPFDPLLRFYNVGWLWVGEYGVIDTDNMVQGVCASSVGAN